MSSMKAFFAAGIIVEEAKEACDRARAALREVAAVKCPDELAVLEAASQALETAEKLMSEVGTAIASGKSIEGMDETLAEHARTCREENCEIRKRYGRSAGGASNKAN